MGAAMTDVSPTRMQLLSLRQQAVIARRGLELLERKREALVREFFAAAGSAIASREGLRQAMQQAHNSLMLLLALAGREAVTSAAFAARRELAVELVERNLWGVRFPELYYQAAARALDARGYALTGTTPHLDETARLFEEVVDRGLKIVSMEMKLKRIGQEIRKATRRINALKELMLPRTEWQIRRIKVHLEEREHEEHFRTKRFKQRASRR